MRGMESERYEAIGERGEACIILLKQITLPSGRFEMVYILATGERLKATDTAGVFVTLSGGRTFRFRQPRVDRDA